MSKKILKDNKAGEKDHKIRGLTFLMSKETLIEYIIKESVIKH